MSGSLDKKGRMIGRKLLLAGALAAVAAASGVYLAGWLVRLLLDVPAPVDASTWWAYVRHIDHPRVAPFAEKIRVAGAVGFGLPLLSWAALSLALWKGGAARRSTHGDARFATRSELARLGLLADDPTGLIVGKLGDTFLRLPGTRHALAAAPTRSGKGVGLVMPNLLDFQGSLVLLDIKQEGFDVTAGYRASLGAVFLFNPFADDLRTHRWNPFCYVRNEPLYRTGDLQAIAACLYKESPGQDPFWSRMGSQAFVAAASLLFDQWAARVSAVGEENARRAFPTLGAVYRLFSGDAGDFKAHLQRLIDQDFAGQAARTGLGSLVALAEQTLSSVVATTQAPLQVFVNPIVEAATSGNDFDLRTLRRQRQTVYVGISPGKLGEANLLLNLFFEQAIKLNAAVLPEQDATLRHQCLFLLDEFTALGRVDILVDGVAWLAGYNVRIFCVIQSLSQLDAVYGPEKARAMVTNLACQVVYTPREQRDANEYSEMLGYTTLHRRNRTSSHGQGGSTSYSEVEERRALMLPQELKSAAGGPGNRVRRRRAQCSQGDEDPLLRRTVLHGTDEMAEARRADPGAEPAAFGHGDRCRRLAWKGGLTPAQAGPAMLQWGNGSANDRPWLAITFEYQRALSLGVRSWVT